MDHCSESKGQQDTEILPWKEEQLSDADCVETLLQLLKFGLLETRREAIPEAYEQTYDWIFGQPPVSESHPDNSRWGDFSKWLEQHSKEVYWITGKPGSGKSTLMKFIFGDRRMNAQLRKWSGSKPCHTAAYFSWNAGAELQKSQEGLLRTLLYQIIRQAPKTAIRLLPNRWAMLKLFGVHAAHNLPAWSCKELHDCMASLEHLTNELNLAIFIDGLDEFEGEHSHLISLVKHLHGQPGLKVCVSSRPWNAFRDAFSGCPQLRMELLTQHDMEAFVRGRFEANVAIAELRNDQPNQPTIVEGLITDIVRKSEGVFLWVSLVTDSVLDGIGEGDTLSDSHRLLEDLPSDISDLYDNLWSRVASEHRGERSRLLCVLDQYSNSGHVGDSPSRFSQGLPQTLLWYSVLEATSPFSAKVLARRLRSRTKGLLEIKLSGCVDYLHRTAHDWIMTKWDGIHLEAPVGFDPHMSLVTGLASTVNLADYGSRCCGDSCHWTSRAFHHFSMVSEQHHSHAVAELDRLADEIMKASRRQEPFSCDALREPCWIYTRRQNCNSFGFATMAAAWGGPALEYVRAKITAEPACYTVVGDERDLIWPIVFGNEGLLGMYACSSRTAAVRNKNLDAEQRFALAQLWFECALNGTRNRAALLSKLTSLYTDVSDWTGYGVARSSSDGTDKTYKSYRKKVLRMLRYYGVGPLWRGRMRRARFVVADLFHK